MGSGVWGMASKRAERELEPAERLTGRPVEGGMRWRSPLEAIGTGSVERLDTDGSEGTDSAGLLSGVSAMGGRSWVCSGSGM
jgi:hypothetical protein